MKKPGATNARLAPPWSVAETDAPLALYVHSGEVTTIVPGGNLATHNSDCVAKWRPWLGNLAVHFLIPPDRKVVVFQNQPKLLVQV
jgi:hypothetical protein